MPEQCRFRGLRITMHSGERGLSPPYAHGQIGSQRAVCQIVGKSRMTGALPVPAKKRRRQWLVLNQTALEEN